MADLFNQDFQDFIAALNKEAVEYILAGGYAVILRAGLCAGGEIEFRPPRLTEAKFINKS